jgi:hypothetical protein
MPAEVTQEPDDSSGELLSWPTSSRRGLASNIRYIGYISGRYTLASRRSRQSKLARVFACRIQSISPEMAVVIGPVIGNVGDRVTANFDDLGLVRGSIIRFVDGGFVVAIEGSDKERRLLAARIDWFRRKTQQSLPDQREHRRYLPRNPRSVLILATGKIMPCFIIDMSVSGVAVSADLTPRLGTPLAVGRVVGRVTRQLDVGFAMKFLSPQKAADLERLLAPERDGAAEAATDPAELQ